MANGVNVKMGVSGVSQFKQNITTAQRSLKTMDAQLALVEKQFKATGDSEQYMQEKSQLLKAKLEEQKAVIEQSEKALAQMNANGVDKASKAFQDMQQQLLKAKGELIDTQTQLQNIGKGGEEAKDGVADMNAQLQRIGDGIKWQNVTQGLDSITDKVGGVLKTIWKLGEALVNNTLSAGEWADELQTTADNYGIDTDKLQRMRKTARLIDTDAETILEAQSKLRIARSKAGKGDMGAWAYLGIDPNQFGEDMEGAEDLFWATGDALRDMEDETQRDAYANELFGRSWKELMPLFNEGRESYNETMARQSTVSEDALQRLKDMDDAYQKMMSEFETAKYELLSELAPALQTIMETLTGLMQEFNKYLQTDEGQAMMESLRQSITGLFDDLKNIDPKEVLEKIKKIIEDIVGAFEWISKHKDEIYNALKWIAGGFLLLKVGSIAANLTSIAKGLGLFGGGKLLASGGGQAVANGATSGLTAAGGGTAAAGGTGFFGAIGTKLTAMGTGIKTFFTTGGMYELGAIAAPVLAIVTAGIAQKEFEKQKVKQQQTWDSYAEKAKQLGMINTSSFLGTGSENLGPKRNANGSYQRDFTGIFLNLNPGDVRSQVMGLKDRKNMELAQLYNDINTYAPETKTGYKTWTLLQRMWEKDDLDAVEESELLTTIMDMEMRRVDAQEARMQQLAQESSQSGKNTLTSEDVSGFKGLPAEIASAVRSGMANVKIYIDGYGVGQVVTPYVGSMMAGSLGSFMR